MINSWCRRLAAIFCCVFLTLAASQAHDGETSAIGARTSLYLFGPEMPFLFEVNGQKLNFAWSDLRSYGDTGIGTLTDGVGEVIGVDGDFWAADSTDPVPRKLTDEVTPSGAVVSFFPRHQFTIQNTVDLNALQTVLDDVFVDTDAFVYLFRATGTLRFVEYQLTAPPPSPDMIEQIRVGNSQAAMTAGSKRYSATNVPMTMVGLRVPPHLATVMQAPYHIHFLADDRSSLGHVTALDSVDLTIEWVKVNAINVHYWDVRSMLQLKQ